MIIRYMCTNGGGRSIIPGGGERQYSYIYVLPFQFLLKSIVFKVCEHEYMNISPPPPQLSIFYRHWCVRVNHRKIFRVTNGTKKGLEKYANLNNIKN